MTSPRSIVFDNWQSAFQILSEKLEILDSLCLP